MSIRNLFGYSTVGIICFIAGVIWAKHQLLESGAVELTQPLKLQSSPTNIGELPKGTILYPYSRGPSTGTFVIFVNTKSLNFLVPHNFQNYMTVSPIDAYVE